MRKINEIVLHHGADARKMKLSEMKSVYQQTHHESLYKKYDQPRSDGPNPDIAYHVLIGTDGWELARNFEHMGYHASNYEVNKHSVGVVLTGHYDRDELSPEMHKWLVSVVRMLRRKFPEINKMIGHRAYATKSCPGNNISPEFVQRVFEQAGKKDAKITKKDELPSKKEQIKQLSSLLKQLSSLLAQLMSRNKA